MPIVSPEDPTALLSPNTNLDLTFFLETSYSKLMVIDLIPKIRETRTLALDANEIEIRNHVISDQVELLALYPKISDFVLALNDDYLNQEPWLIFNVWLDNKFDPNSVSYSLFRAWQIFHWKPDPDTLLTRAFDLKSKTIADAFLKKNFEYLTESEINLLKSGSNQKFDIYEVIAIRPDCLLLYGHIHQRKLITFTSQQIQNARIGEFIFGCAAIKGRYGAVLFGSSEFFPPNIKRSVLEFVDFISSCGGDTLNSFENLESDYFNFYYDIKLATNSTGRSTKK